MLTELSLNVLDIAQNSIRAEANLIQISIEVDTASDRLRISVHDNGVGMTPEQLSHVEDPFYTTRTTRKIGLGVPFFKMAALSTGGDFSIESSLGNGTEIIAVFGLSHIDRMPLGDMTGTMVTLITMNPDIDFLYTYRYNNRSFILDTREFREILGDIPLNSPEVSVYVKEYLEENKRETDGGIVL